MNDQPVCAHIDVEYRPIQHPDGSQSERWECDDCGTEFLPAYRLPLLGYATTEQMLIELQSRAEVGGYADYRTVS